MRYRKAAFTVAVILLTVAVTGTPATAYSDTSRAVHRAIGVKARDVMSGTILNATVLPGREKQVVAMTTYFTGAKEKELAVNVRLDIFRWSHEKLVPVYHRDLGKENNGNVGRGELQLVDLDLDGVSEIIITWDDHSDSLIRQRRGEVIIRIGDEFKTAWSGAMEYDATRSARKVPVERRDRFVREIDHEKTMRTRGVTLFMQKTVIAVAGERLAEPKVVQETFPFKKSASRW